MKKVYVIVVAAVFLAAFSFGQAQQQSTANGDQSSQLPPEQAVGRAPLILGYDIAPSATVEDVAYGPTNTSLGYKGVLMGDFDNNSDAADELLVDFGASGLWYYNNGTWHQESGLNPQGMIVVHHGDTPDDEAVVDFGTTGLWYWDYGSWTQLSGANADGMFACDDELGDGNDEIQVDFGALGIWHCNVLTRVWKQFSGLNPSYGLRMDFWTAGIDEGVWCFSGPGMWNMWVMNDGSLSYRQLTGTNTGSADHVSANFVNTTGPEDLVADFITLGMWLYKGDMSGWVQVSAMNPNRVKEVKFMGTADYEILAEDIDTGILYWGNWNGNGMDWDQITATAQGPGWCETCDWDGIAAGESEEVFIPINTGGMYRYDYDSDSLTSVLNTLYKVNFAVRGDPYGVGYDSTLALAMTATGGGTPGLYLYDSAHGYELISGLVPDGIY